MKKLAVFLMLIAITLCCAFAFTACGDSDAETSQDNSAESYALVMDKRYIMDDDAQANANKQSSFVFHSDGTGEYTYHYDYSSSGGHHYIIHFKYTYVDSDNSTVVCFYDSLERLTGDDGSYISTDWSKLVTVSKNVLMTVATSYTFWINEDYLKTLNNFGK